MSTKNKYAITIFMRVLFKKLIFDIFTSVHLGELLLLIFEAFY